MRSTTNPATAIPDSAENVRSRHHRLTHAYLIAPSDYARFAELGVVVDFQQGPDSIDPDYHEDLTELIGDRSFDLIPTQALVDAGAHVILSSDWDTDPLSPVATIGRALTRPTQAMRDVEHAARMVTIDTAEALGHDDTTGSIEVGKFADMVLLDQDIFSIDPEAIAATRVLVTWLNGRVVHLAGGLPGE